MPSNLDYLESYSVLTGISDYTCKWIKKYWGKDSRLLYPPVMWEIDRPITDFAVKRNVILSVGRFFTSGHSKKQLEMVRTFKVMCDAGLTGWEFHLAGGTHAEHGAYVQRVVAEAEGYPVFLHFDVERDRLKALYGQARIFWHAAGYGENREKSPEMFEHFGITTVEAMAYGAVPVVFAGGGQAEIVGQGSNGYLWGTLDELREKTLMLTSDEARMNEFGRAAAARSRDFSREAFATRLYDILKPLL